MDIMEISETNLNLGAAHTFGRTDTTFVTFIASSDNERGAGVELLICKL